jgi:hypothetical protein
MYFYICQITPPNTFLVIKKTVMHTRREGWTLFLIFHSALLTDSSHPMICFGYLIMDDKIM